MDSPWGDDGPESNNVPRENEWTRISDQFANAGYREGITVGKEASLQEGFDEGFASVGVSLGHEIGVLRGLVSSVLAYLLSPHFQSHSSTAPPGAHTAILQEIRDIANELSDVRFSDIAPPDLQAEEHARLHLEQTGEEMDVTSNESLVEKRRVEQVEDMFASLTATGTEKEKKKRPTLEDVGKLKGRLSEMCQVLGLGIDVGQLVL